MELLFAGTSARAILAAGSSVGTAYAGLAAFLFLIDVQTGKAENHSYDRNDDDVNHRLTSFRTERTRSSVPSRSS